MNDNPKVSIPKISIIIPVYNTSMYLDKCLNSLLNQTLKEIEIICINDGSTDNSLEILQNFARTDGRIQIIDQKNQGQSAARNAGIKEAKGEYIGFLDSDDWADEKMFKKLYDRAKQTDSDMTMCSIAVYNEKTKQIATNDPYLTLSLFPESLKAKTFTYKDCLDFLFRICVVPWNKIYKNEWLKKHGIKFLEGVNFEDMVFTIEALIHADSITLVDEPLVYYRKASQTSYSVGNCSFDYKKLDFFTIFEKLEQILKENSIYNKFEEYFKFYKRNNLIYWYEKIQNKKIKKQYYKKLIKLYPDFRFNGLILFFKKLKLRKEIEKLAKDNKIVVWMVSTPARSVLPKSKTNKENQNILGFVDDNIELQGKTIDGYKIYPIEKLKELNPDCILAITQNYYKFGNLVKIKLEDYGLMFKVIDLII